MNDLISVVIPSYNCAAYITSAVDGVLHQSYANVEVIVIDDGSTDDTRERLGPWMDRIRYIYQANQGIAAARNAGLRAATGKYVALLDADDIWHPRKLELQARYLDAHPDVGLVAADAYLDMPSPWPELDDRALDGVVPVSLDDLLLCTRFGTSSVLLRRECPEQVGYFDRELQGVEDRHMWVRVATRFGVAKFTAPLFWYRIHDNNISRRAALMDYGDRKMICKLFDEVPALRGRGLMKRQSLSYAAFQAAMMYRELGQTPQEVGRVLRSIVLWPFPYRNAEVRTPFRRLKRLILSSARLIQGRGRSGQTAAIT